MIILSELLEPNPSRLWSLVRQAGVEQIVTILDGAEQQSRWLVHGAPQQATSRGDEAPWSKARIRELQQRYAGAGLSVASIEDTPPMDRVRLGAPGRDEVIDEVIAQVRAMGECGIPVLCYNWMAITSWARTELAVPIRGGALSTGFRHENSQSMPPLRARGEVTETQLWDALTYFLHAVVPVAEEAGVRMALHPDDPPLTEIRGVPRIIRSLDAYRRVLDIYPSHANAITLCQGNFALMTHDLPAAIREFGARNAVAFVHFRDVLGHAEDFIETFHDAGQTDLPECMRAYRDVDFHGPMRPDHVPSLAGEIDDKPGYATLGRLFALGYIRGLQQAVYGK